ncbi:MAG TPA: pyridoxamine 5'-phosphate oxidase family protein [Thermoanaerobacterales bacterium]|nr:pyridoxamine 5'-phosphate oxidase family protein [Thermoanaerobacterales bacterium]
MSKILGSELTRELVNLLNSKGVTVVLATISGDNYPNTTPVHLITAPNEKKVRMALGKMHQSYMNIKANENVMINILESNDTAISIKGNARIIKDPMEGNKNMAMVEVEVLEIKSDTTPTLIVTDGIKTKHRTAKTPEFFRLMFDELNS